MTLPVLLLSSEQASDLARWRCDFTPEERAEGERMWQEACRDFDALPKEEQDKLRHSEKEIDAIVERVVAKPAPTWTTSFEVSPQPEPEPTDEADWWWRGQYFSCDVEHRRMFAAILLDFYHRHGNTGEPSSEFVEMGLQTPGWRNKHSHAYRGDDCFAIITTAPTRLWVERAYHGKLTKGTLVRGEPGPFRVFAEVRA